MVLCLSRIATTLRVFNRLLLFLLIGLSHPAAAQAPVYVAAYDYPPYFSDVLETDLTRELVSLLNNYQSSYDLKIKVIPAAARYKALSRSGCCDVIFFEAPVWGWDKSGVDYRATFPLSKGSERMVTKQRPGIDQSYFQDYTDKTLGGVKGYHFLLGGELLDSTKVKEKYRIYLADSRVANLRMVLGGRVDLAVINDELLSALEGSSQLRVDQLLLADNVDFNYKLSLLVGEKNTIDVETLQRLVREIGRRGELDRLYRRFNMERYQLYRPSTIR